MSPIVVGWCGLASTTKGASNTMALATIMILQLLRPNPTRGQDPMPGPHPKPSFLKPAASIKRASRSKSEKPLSPLLPRANMLQASLTRRKAARRAGVAAKALGVPKLKAQLTFFLKLDSIEDQIANFDLLFGINLCQHKILI